MRIKLNFKDFTTLESYCKLQEQFVFKDYRNGFYEQIKEPFEDKEITINDSNFYEEENFQDVTFIDDFIMPNISKMAKYRKSQFLKEIHSKSLLTKDLREGLAERYLSNIRKTSNKLSNASHLSEEIIYNLELQLNIIEDFIKDYLANPYPEIEKKIQFKWSRTDVIYFFHLLRLTKEINDISNADLGRIIDGMCEWSKEDVTLPIKDSSKHLSDFKSTSGRSETKAIERLSAIFNKDFFNV